MVIVKDMSRFGQNYLKASFYTEMLFPGKGVQFIAINNRVDSETQGENGFTPFLNIMNEWYAKDTSKKIRTMFKAEMREGKRVSPSVPYGYLRDPQDKQHLIIDEEPAKVVRRIYQITIEGYGKRDIAKALTADKILIPAAYAAEHCLGNDHSHGWTNLYEWSCTAGKAYNSDNAFICGSYRSLHRDCTMHYIKVSVVEELIKKAIHTVSSFAIENEEEFIRRLEVLSDF